MKKIVQKDEKVLRQIAEEVPVNQITGQKIQKILEEMREALRAESDGVGLAAPQIGYSLRIFIITSDLLLKNKKRQTPALNAELVEFKKQENFVFINPEIIKLSKDKKIVDEGCLSVRPLYGKIERSTRAKIQAYDKNGKPFQQGAKGLLAQIFQHEIDHLNGILFIDKAFTIKEIHATEITNPTNS